MKSSVLTYDPLLLEIADYAAGYTVENDAALNAARHCLLDSLACALEALEHPECTRLLGPVVPGAVVATGARVPGTSWMLDPVKAGFDIATAIRWLDLSDTWTSKQTTHPSDDIGSILALCDWLSRSGKPVTMLDALQAIAKAHELQGGLGAHMPITTFGIDNVFLTKLACAAVLAQLLDGDRTQVANAVSLAFFEPSLCVHRFGSNTGPRKGWAGADATADAMRFAMMAVAGEPGYPQVLSHPVWGFNRHFLDGKALQLGPVSDRVIQGVQYKFYPAVVHVQSQVECAIALHPKVKDRLDDIASIAIETHREPMAKISKTGPLRNPADRDHCMQYSVAVALLKGALSAHDYEDEAAADPRIDTLRGRITASENPHYTARFDDPERRANPAAVEVRFRDGRTERCELEYPAGHFSRRSEGLAMIEAKFRTALALRFDGAQQQRIAALAFDHERLLRMPVHEFTDAFAADVIARSAPFVLSVAKRSRRTNNPGASAP
ncbi:MAG TPA: 2-methylcitrate dehydratase [Burkholderiales bacterium]|nr:2-methylcitrate dehydratase [Burkholderiales bacterium]